MPPHADQAHAVRARWVGPWLGWPPPRLAWVYAVTVALSVHGIEVTRGVSPWTVPVVLAQVALMPSMVRVVLVGHTPLENLGAALALGLRLGLLSAVCVAALVPVQLAYAWLQRDTTLASPERLAMLGVWVFAASLITLAGTPIAAFGFRAGPDRHER